MCCKKEISECCTVKAQYCCFHVECVVCLKEMTSNKLFYNRVMYIAKWNIIHSHINIFWMNIYFSSWENVFCSVLELAMCNLIMIIIYEKYNYLFPTKCGMVDSCYDVDLMNVINCWLHLHYCNCKSCKQKAFSLLHFLH